MMVVYWGRWAAVLLAGAFLALVVTAEPVDEDGRQPKRWAEVVAKDEFQALEPLEQEAMRQRYFDEIVAPQTTPATYERAWQEFDEHSRAVMREQFGPLSDRLASGQVQTMAAGADDDDQRARLVECLIEGLPGTANDVAARMLADACGYDSELMPDSPGSDQFTGAERAAFVECFAAASKGVASDTAARLLYGACGWRATRQ